MDENESLFGKTISDLRRRKVFRVAAAYGIVAWLSIEVASVVLPALHAPEWTVSAIVIAAIAGFPVVLLLSWIFDLTPQGVVRTEAQGENAEAVSRFARRGIDFVVIGVLLAIVGYLAYQQDFFATDDPGEHSIAVLPFVDMSADGDNEYFSDGISEELLNSLVGIDGLRVAARTSSFAFKGRNEDIREIGEKLNVGTVLEGSVRRSGNQVRITAQLINVEDGFHLWSDTFDRRFDDIFVIQAEIARSIVEALELELVGATAVAMPGAAEVDIRAYDLYLLGRHHWHERTEESLGRALSLFQEAISIDPDFALAYTGLADTYLLMDGYSGLSMEKATARAEAPVARALALDDQLAEAYASLGLLRLNQGDLGAAELALRNAVDLNPNYSMAHMWLGIVLSRTEGPNAALAEYRLARETDPLHPTVNFNLAQMLGESGRYEEASAHLRESLAADPDNEKAYLAMSDLNLRFGRFDEAARWAMKGIREFDYASSHLAMAKIHTHLGQFDRAEAYFSQAEDRVQHKKFLIGARAEFLYLSGRLGELNALVEEFDGESKESARLIWQGIAEVVDGDKKKGVELLRQGMASAVEQGLGAEDQVFVLSIQAYAEEEIGQADAARSTRSAALEMATEAEKMGWSSPGLDATTGLLLRLDGQRSKAEARMQTAIDRGWRDYWNARSHPAFAQLIADDVFGEMLNVVEEDMQRMRVVVDRLEEQAAATDRVAGATLR
jgi:TolB-like protein/Tfp pilus assembly protein PilF